MTDFGVLVDELDDRLPVRADADPVIVKRRVIPTWVAFVVLSALLIGVGTFLLRPTTPTCEFDETICAIESIDIDALYLTIPEAALFEVLPPIASLDPGDHLTAGDVFSMEQFKHLNGNALITQDQLDRVLGLID